VVSRETSPTGDGPATYLRELCRAMGVDISRACAGALVAVLDAMASEAQNLTSIDDLTTGIERHLADSLSGLTLSSVRDAASIVDVGSGGGFPGLALAAALPQCAVTLNESEGRKAEWLVRASARFPNVRVVSARSEDLARLERESYSCATARAVGSLPVVLELTAPLVELGGSVVAWRAEREPEAEAAAAEAADELGLLLEEVRPVTPFPGARRHLHLYRKVAATPARYPRRPGRAAKRPLA
jgi:16S rRNA (guanine527-N7)-methyltransferase